jgi:hypothetical protein
MSEGQLFTQLIFKIAPSLIICISLLVRVSRQLTAQLQGVKMIIACGKPSFYLIKSIEP